MERDGLELDLRISLGSAWIALRGWPAAQVWRSLEPALALANSLGRRDALLPILWGLFINVFTRGRVAESLGWVAQIKEAAKVCQDRDLRMLMHLVAADSYHLLGELIQAREHATQVLTLGTEQRRGRLADVLNQHPTTMASVHTADCTWMLGYPEQAIRISDEKDTAARRDGNPFNIGWALTRSAQLFDYIREPDEAQKCIQEAERLGYENSLPILTEMMVPWQSGIVLIRNGQIAAGVASLKAGLAVWQGSGGGLLVPYSKSVLAEGAAQIGDLDGAFDLIQESIVQIERPGWEERSHYPQILRIKGWLLSLKGDVEGAERDYLASLDWARHQQAKSWELRTAT